LTYVVLHSVVFALILLVLAGTGTLWDALLFAPGGASRDERRLALLITSGATWVIVSFLLCALHLLTASVVAGTCCLIMLGAVWARQRRGGQDPDPQETGEPRDRRLLVIVAPIIFVLGAIYVVALSPIPGWDSDVYHLTIARLYVQARGFVRIPFNVYSNWPLSGSLLYALVLLFSDHVSAGLIHFAFGLATTFALVIGCRRSGVAPAGWAGGFAVALFWMNPIVQYEAASAYVDLISTFFFLAAFLCAGAAFDRPAQQRSWLLLTGVSAGMLAGTKVNGTVSVAVIAAYVFWRQLRREEGRPTPGAWWTWSALPALLLMIAWPLKSWILTGNPVYPFLHSRLGGPEWSDTLTAEFAAWQRSIGMGHGVVDDLLLPVRVILEGAHDYQHFNGELSPAWIVLLPLGIWTAWRHRFARECLGAAGLHFVLWAASSQQMRFLIPTLALVCLGTAVGLASAAGRRAGSWLPVAGAVLGALLLLSGWKPKLVLDAPGEGPALFASAAEWWPAYLRKNTKLPGSAVKPIYRYIDTRLPATARLLLVGTNLGYYVERNFAADSFFEASQIADWMKDAATEEEAWQRLRAAGFTHILVGETSIPVTYPATLAGLIHHLKSVRSVFRDERYHFNLLEICGTPGCDVP
jgi:hypothetical protein